MAPANTQPTDDRELDRDRVSVVRGALVNFMGHLLRLAEPLLTLAVVRLYGEAVWGHFILAESIAYFGTRLATLGLDKGMLWSISRSRAEGGSYSTQGLHGGLIVGVTTAVVIAALGWLFSEALVLDLFTEPGALKPTQIILLSLPLSVGLTIVLHAIMATRSMGPDAVIRGGVLPIVTRGVPLVLLPLAMGASAVAWGHVLAYGVALGLAWRLLQRRLREVEARTDAPFAWPSREVMGFSLPAGLADLLATIMVRVDVWMLAWLLDAAAVGIYGVILSLVASVRTVRRAFDPVIVPIMSEATALGQVDRIRASFSQATFLVGCLTGPILAFIWCFGQELLGLYGRAFETGAAAILILSAGSLCHSVLGLANTVLQGAGRGGLMLVTTVVLIALNTSMNWFLIPLHGITGAAMATATALAGVSALEYGLARWILRAPLVNWAALEPLVAAAVSTGVAAPVYLLMDGEVGSFSARISAFCVMAIAYGLWFRSRGLPAFRLSKTPAPLSPEG